MHDCMYDFSASYSRNLEWNLKSHETVRHEVKYDCCPNIYPDITFYLNFERRSMFYVLNLVFPIAMITILTIMSFVLPHESGMRLFQTRKFHLGKKYSFQSLSGPE